MAREADGHDLASSLVPFEWEESPGTPKTSSGPLKPDDAGIPSFFEGVSAQSNRISPRCIAGDKAEIVEDPFEDSKGRPLKLPPRLEVVPVRRVYGLASARVAKSPPPISCRFRSPRQRAKAEQFDPFEMAIKEAILRSNLEGDATKTTGSKHINGNHKERTLRDCLPIITMLEGNSFRHSQNQTSPSKMDANKTGVFSSFRSPPHSDDKNSRGHARKAWIFGSLKKIWPEEHGGKASPSRQQLPPGCFSVHPAVTRVLRKAFGP